MKRSLFGYGKTTKALAKIGNWDIYDDSFTINSQDKLGNNLLKIECFDPNISILEIPSPGFPQNHSLIKKSKNLISEYDYFFNDFPFCVWISGTNGKTTTTKMIEFLLSKKGAIMGGNVGTPLASMDKKAPIWILETSSFTLNYTKKAYPDIYVLLPITNDHISWHGNYENYEKSKLKPLSMMQQGSIAIVPEAYKDIETNAFLITYKDVFELANYFNININEIVFKTPFLMDAIMALAVEKIIFDKISIKKINTFIIEPHKLQEFQDSQNRLWVNDTKATNIDAALEALKRYKGQKILLILGGDDKGVDMKNLFFAFKNLNIEIFAIGSNTEKLMNLAKDFNIKAHKCHNIENAVIEIHKIHDTNQIALLSPAAASLDQFTSYAHRGEVFMNLVKKL